MKKKKLLVLVLVIAVFLILVNCVPIFKAPPLVLDNNSFELSQNHQIGQTFRAEFNGINGIEVYLLPKESGNGIIIAHLLNDPIQKKELAKSSIDISSVLSEQYYLFLFPSSPELERDNYFVALEIEGDGSVFVASRDKDAYLDGSIYIDGEPLEGQMVFQLKYDQKYKILGLVREFVYWSYLIFLSVVVFVIPGFAALSFLVPSSKNLSLFERLALSLGISIAIYPLILLWTDLLNIHLGKMNVWIPVLAGATYIIWSNGERIKNKKTSYISNKRCSIKSLIKMKINEKFVLVILVLLIFFTRFWAIRELPGPMWGDSVHHTMISRLIVDNGGLFDSWKPYAELSSLTYHFGFHSAVAVFHWISGVEVIDSVLFFGQIINGFAVFMLYPLVKSFTKNVHLGGIVAILTAGLLLKFPMFYVNWGRYTQLTGQVIVPVIMILFVHLLKQEEFSWKVSLIIAILMAGLGLTHYRVFVLAIPFCLIAILFYVNKQNVKHISKNLLFAGVLSLIMFLPWLNNIWGGELADYALTGVSSSLTDGIKPAVFFDQLISYYPLWLWITFILGFLYALVFTNKSLFIIFTWSLAIVISVNPHWLGLPGDGLIDDLTVLIGFYIPLSVVLGLLIEGTLSKAPRLLIIQKPLLLIMLVIGILGTTKQNLLLNRDFYGYITWPDKRAFDWIKENTTPDSKFLVNFELSYDDSAVTGIDAGWWIPQIAFRETNLPPLLFTSEVGIVPDYYQKVMEFSNNTLATMKGNQDVCTYLLDSGYDYIYLGQHPLKESVFDSEFLSDQKCIKLEYQQDLVWIYKIY